MEKSKLPRHKLEELRRKEDEARAQEVYKEFVETFEGSRSKTVKTFIRGEVVNPETGDKSIGNKTRLYKPAPSFVQKQESPYEAARKAAEEKAKRLMEEAAAKIRPQKLGKKKEEKPKSNLEAFKDELRRVQEEREERRKLRKQLQEQLGMDSEPLDKIAPSLDNPYLGTYDSDPLTTNLFMSNLNPKSNEEDVCRVFGRFGPLASVKIMWPRSDEERGRGYLTGFVAYMTRKDADRAAAYLKGREISGYEMKLNWGKPVPIPQHPIYIPPRMLEMTLPPPPSGLPFNAQPKKEDREAFEAKWQLPPPGSQPIVDVERREAWEKMIKNAVVKVVIPTERPLLCLIHRLVEFVVREGPMFEAMVMNKEINNHQFRFLFDNQSPAHVYYRWKLFSILQGDSATKWRGEEFRLFENGSVWRPPPVDFYHQGMPMELYDEAEKIEAERASAHSPRRRRHSGESPKREEEPAFVAPLPVSAQNTSSSSRDKHSKKSALSDSQRRKLTEMLDNLTPEREHIANAMIYCVEHAEGAEEIVAMIEDGIANSEISLTRKIAKLYLVADILANCAAKIVKVSYYRKFFGIRLEAIFQHLHMAYARIDARLKAEPFKQRVLACCRIWEDAAIYTTDFLIKLQNIFLGLSIGTSEDSRSKLCASTDFDGEEMDEDLEGVPMADNDETEGARPLVDYDLDGVPLEDEDDSAVTNGKTSGRVGDNARNEKEATAPKPAFIQSKWETVEPEVVRDQALTLSKWEQLEQEEKARSAAANVSSALAAVSGYSYDDDLDGVPMDDDTTANSPQAQSSTPSSTPVTASNQTWNKNEMTEEKRQLLREVEVKVMKYQDELESGQRDKPRGASINEEVEKYRQKMLKKVEEKDNMSAHTRRSESDKKTSNSSKHSSISSASATSRSKGDSERKREKDSLSSKRKRRSRSRSRSAGGSRRSKHAKRSRSRSRSPSSRGNKKKR